MSGWFANALENVKKSAEQIGENAKALGDQVSSKVTEQAPEMLDMFRDLADGDSLKRAFDVSSQPKEEPLPPSDLDRPPWEIPPAGWEVRRKEWRILVQNLCLDDNTFLVGPAGRSEPSHIDFERSPVTDKCQVACTAYEPLADVRFRLSPKYVGDGDFWENFAWKARELGKKSTVQELGDTLRLLNTDPKGPLAPGAPRLKNRGIVQETDVIAEVMAKVAAEEGNTKRLQELAQAITDEAKTSEESAALLTRILARGGTTNQDLKGSVYESCLYHKQKVEQLLVQIAAEDAESKAALTASSRLEEALPALDKAINYYNTGTTNDTQPTAERSQAGSPSSDRAASPAADTPAEAPAAGTKSPACPEVPSTKVEQTALSEDYFGGALPWEDDTTLTPEPTGAATAEDLSSPWEDAAPSSPENK